MSTPIYAINSLDVFEAEAPQRSFAGRDREEATVVDETPETELAKRLLTITNEDELDSFFGALVERSTGTVAGRPGAPELRRILRQVATTALPSINGSDGFGAQELNGKPEGEVAAAAGEVLGQALNGSYSEEEELRVARRLVRFSRESARNFPYFRSSASTEIAARRAVGAALLQELYEAPESLSDGLVSFEYPLYFAEDEELDYFLGRLVRRATKAVGSAGKGVGKGLSAIDKVVPVSMLTRGLSMTPIGMAVNAGLGAVRAAADGRNVFQGALRTMAATPGMRFLVDTGMAVARGDNLVKAAKSAMQAGIGDVRKSMQFAAMVAPFVPGVGTGVAAALSAANALASGQPISDALIAGARGALPGGAIAQMAFDTALNLAKGKNVGEALLNSARARLPGGPAAQAAFDAAVTLAKGKSIQDAAFAATGRLLPRSPYAADALAFVKKVAAGQNIQRAALSSAGNLVLSRIERKTGPMFSSARTKLTQGPSKLAARTTRIIGQIPQRQRGQFEVSGTAFFDELNGGAPKTGETDNAETGTEDTVSGEIEEMELAAELLDITQETELDGFLRTLISRATGGALQPAGSHHLRELLRRAAADALPIFRSGASGGNTSDVGHRGGLKLADEAGDLFGLELEGLSPEDQEFEVARRFVRFAGAGARRARRFRTSMPPATSARRALRAAARRHAPGFLRRRRWWPRSGMVVLPGDPDPDNSPPQPLEPAAGDTNYDTEPNTLPDNEPANSTEPQSQPSNNTDMHDLDHTTLELNNEAENFETEEFQEYSGQAETLFNEDEEAEFAANLLEINDEAELDQFIGDLLKRAKKHFGETLRSPLLQPLGGFIKGAIKKALPFAGGALGNMLVPGIGGQIGSRLASGAGDLLGLELEGLAPEDQEFEVAKQLVRTAGTAIQNAANAGVTALTAGGPQAAAKAAMITAARAHLPGLLQTQANGTGPHHHRPRTGRWYRRGSKIVLVGV